MLRQSASIIVLAALGLAGAASGQSGTFCDTGFQKVDTDSDGVISADERGAADDVLFDVLDADDDGDVSREEYLQCYGRLAMRQSALGSDRSAENMAAADLDGDGRITEAEFMEASGRALAAAQQAGGESVSGDEAGVDPATPLEGTGGLGSTAVAPNVGTPLDGTGTALNRFMDKPTTERGTFETEEFFARSSQTFKALDTDRSGSLSEEEWAQATAVRGDISEVLNMSFDALDTDASDTISRAEYGTDSEARWTEARQDATAEGRAVADGVPVIVYYRYRFGL